MSLFGRRPLAQSSVKWCRGQAFRIVRAALTRTQVGRAILFTEWLRGYRTYGHFDTDDAQASSPKAEGGTND